MAPKKRASSDYEEPGKNVANQKGRVVLPPTKARQGLLDRDLLYMLIIGMALTMLALAALYFGYVNFF